MKIHNYTLQTIIDLYKEFKMDFSNDNDLEASIQNPHRRKIFCLIDNLDPEVRAEFMAVMWIGRGDGKAKDFESLKQYAMSGYDNAGYAIEKPLDEYLINGMKILGIKIEE